MSANNATTDGCPREPTMPTRDRVYQNFETKKHTGTQNLSQMNSLTPLRSFVSS